MINDGKLAVVLGIEVELFGCTEFQDVPQCTIDDVKAGTDEVQKARRQLDVSGPQVRQRVRRHALRRQARWAR